MDIKPELKQYLSIKKWKYRMPDRSGNLTVQTCPFCGKTKWKFYIHAQKTLYHCFTCQAKGNLYRLKRELGDLDNKSVVSAAHAAGDDSSAQEGKPVPMKMVDRWHQQLMKTERALEYCDKRGFDLQTIKHFRLGLQKKHGIYWLTIPHINHGVCYNVKFRSLPPSEKRFRRVRGASSVLFNADALDDYDKMVLVEAELDAISMWQAGVRNVVSLTGGAETFPPEWYDVLADKDEITICLDADAVGQGGARTIARRLGFDKCFNLILPYHDANEMLKAAGAGELAREVAKGGERFEVYGVVSAADAMLQCRTRSELGDEGFLTPWESLNRLLGAGWQLGDLVVLSAKIKVGKTTWALNQAVHLASKGTPCLIYCLEMSVDRLAEKVAAVLRKKPIDDLTHLDFSIARYMLREMPLYFVAPDWGGSLKVDAVFDKIRESVKRYGIKFMVFDHLHFLCRSLQHLTAEVGQVTRGFKLLSQELDMVTLLIAQPKKIQGERVIKYDDIKDSSSIPADADQIILLHRQARPASLTGGQDVSSEDDAEVLDPKTLVRIDAARFRGGGNITLWYEGASATFYEMDDRPGLHRPPSA